jgi:hypothetical protein
LNSESSRAKRRDKKRDSNRYGPDAQGKAHPAFLFSRQPPTNLIQPQAMDIQQKTFEFIKFLTEAHNDLCARIQFAPSEASERVFPSSPRVLHDLYVASLAALNDTTAVAEHWAKQSRANQTEAERMRAEFEKECMRRIELEQVVAECWRLLYPLGDAKMHDASIFKAELKHKVTQWKQTIQDLQLSLKSERDTHEKQRSNLVAYHRDSTHNNRECTDFYLKAIHRALTTLQDINLKAGDARTEAHKILADAWDTPAIPAINANENANDGQSNEKIL